MFNSLIDQLKGMVYFYGEESYLTRIKAFFEFSKLNITSIKMGEEDKITEDEKSILVVARNPHRYIRKLISLGVVCDFYSNKYFGLPEPNFKSFQIINNVKSPYLDLYSSGNVDIEVNEIGFLHNEDSPIFMSIGVNSKCRLNYVTFEEGVRIFLGNNSTLSMKEGTYISANTEIIIGNNCDVEILEDVLISENTVFNLADYCDLEIGKKTTIGPYFECYAYASISIGENCMISSNVYIDSGDGHDITINNEKNYPQKIKLGERTWVGKNASILMGTNLFPGSIVGTNTIIKNKKITKPSIIFGNPNQIKDDPFCWQRHYSHYIEVREENKVRKL